MSRDKRRKGNDGSRDAGGFVALPWAVLDSAPYQLLSHPARSLLMELARQYVRDNNGRLLTSEAYLIGKRGWKSGDTITRAKRELMDGGFIHETVRGHRPNKASWYALTFYSIDRIAGYDPGALESFERSAYCKNARLTPSRGVETPSIAPAIGVGHPSTTPVGGAMRASFRTPSTPAGGDHLDMPSPGSQKRVEGMRTNSTLAELWEKLAPNKSRLWHVGPRGPVIGVGALMHRAA